MAIAEVETCTCPSGDGSLRWPCPQHPPESSNKEETFRIVKGVYNKEAAREALLHNLFIRGWTLRHQLEDAACGGPYTVTLAENSDGLYVGVVLADFGYFPPWVSVFVRENYRRRGIGTMLIEDMKKDHPTLTYRKGIPGSELFYEKNGVRIKK